MFKKLVGLLTVAVAGLFLSSVAFAEITGSAHDFAKTGGFNLGGEICVACHTPHSSDTSISEAPLWNHEMTAGTQTYTVYTNAATLDATVGQPAGISKLCLSCHDGTVALDSFGGAAGTEFIATNFGYAEVGVDLADDHPISFTYDGALETADGSLNDPASAPVAALLYSGQLECASCHDVHNNGLGSTALLRVDNAGSALCLTCHAK